MCIRHPSKYSRVNEKQQVNVYNVYMAQHERWHSKIKTVAPNVGVVAAVATVAVLLCCHRLVRCRQNFPLHPSPKASAGGKMMLVYTLNVMWCIYCVHMYTNHKHTQYVRQDVRLHTHATHASNLLYFCCTRARVIILMRYQIHILQYMTSIMHFFSSIWRFSRLIDLNHGIKATNNLLFVMIRHNTIAHLNQNHHQLIIIVQKYWDWQRARDIYVGHAYSNGKNTYKFEINVTVITTLNWNCIILLWAWDRQLQSDKKMKKNTNEGENSNATTTHRHRFVRGCHARTYT